MKNSLPLKTPSLYHGINQKLGTKWEHFGLREKKNPLRDHLKGFYEVPGALLPVLITKNLAL
ncbi:MAG: hypothetical protein E7G31_06730 [Bacteroides sp.]|nr:hypothetical protein [Bacteroides sp.]